MEPGIATGIEGRRSVDPPCRKVRVIAKIMIGLIVAGLLNSFVIAPRIGGASLHPLSAFGYLVFALRLSLCDVEPRWRRVWLGLHTLVLAVALQRLCEAFVPGLPGLFRHFVFSEWKETLGFAAGFSVETALGLAVLHLVLLLEPLGRRFSVLALLGAAGVATLVLLQAVFGMVLWHKELSVFSLGCILLGCLAAGFRLRDMALISPFFGHGGPVVMLRLMLVAALAVPWFGGYVYFRMSGIDQTDHYALEFVFGLIGWVMLLLVVATGHFMEKSRRDLVHASHHDTLTGAMNRHGLFAATERLDGAQGVILFDLDHFKRHNDVLGHAEGDRLLRDVARITPAGLATRGYLRALGRGGISRRAARPG